eukprot:scaffold25827_cov108-Isochrysis_galbana.AAC.2
MASIPSCGSEMAIAMAALVAARMARSALMGIWLATTDSSSSLGSLPPAIGFASANAPCSPMRLLASASDRSCGVEPAASACARATAPASPMALPPHGAPRARTRSAEGLGCESRVPASATQPSSPIEFALRSSVSKAGMPVEAKAAASGRTPVHVMRQKLSRKCTRKARTPERSSPKASASRPASPMRLEERSSVCSEPPQATSSCERHRTPSTVKKLEEKSSRVSAGNGRWLPGPLAPAPPLPPAARAASPAPAISAAAASNAGAGGDSRRSSANSKHKSLSSMARLDTCSSPVEITLGSDRLSLARTAATSTALGQNSPILAS